MSKTDKTYELIKSLSKSEKRFFKIYSNRHVIGESNNYVQLFDAMDKLDAYDENQLKSQFNKEKFVSRLAVTKAYLYDLILRSMSAYNQQNNAINQVYEYLQQVHFLFNKNLIYQANLVLLKAKKIAEQYKHSEILPEIIEWQKRIIEASNYKIIFADSLKSFFEETSKLNEEMNLMNNFWYLQAQLYFQHNLSGIIKNKEDFNLIEDIFSARFMQLDNKELSFKSLLLKNKIYATYFFQVRDYESCFKYTYNLVELIEGLEDHSLYLVKEYIQTISNLLNVSKALNNSEIHQKYMNKLQDYYENKEKYKSEILKLRIVEAFHYHKMSVLDVKNLEKRFEHLDLLEADLVKYEDNINSISKSILFYFAFHICFDANDFKNAYKWLLKIENAGSQKTRPDIYAFSKILIPITLFELDKITECKQKIKALYLFKSRIDSKTKFDLILLDNIKKLTRLHEKNDLKNWLTNYREELKTLKEDPFERKIFDYFKFESWIESKIQNKSYSEIINKKAIA